MLKRLLPLLALTSFAISCGDDATKSNDVANTGDVADSTPPETIADEPVDPIDPATIRVYTSAEVCALVSQETATATLGVDVTEVSTSEMSTPQCSYEFTTADGTFSNLTLAVQRPNEDLGGLAGKAGFEYSTSFAIFDTAYEPLEGVGDEAAVSASAAFNMIVVLVNDQVFTVATSAPIGVANLVAFGNAVAENL